MRIPKERGNTIYALVGKCFGLLGAIDIGILDNDLLDGAATDLANHNATVYDHTKFPVEVLSELCRSFVSASSTRAQDCAAYAMQETLQFYKCSTNKNRYDDCILLVFPCFYFIVVGGSQESVRLTT